MNKLPADAFYAQFHNHDAPHFHSVDHPTKEWWEVYDEVPEASQGQRMQYARGGKIGKDEHPATKIPGVHIRTAEAGEPVFLHEDEEGR
jgi:hypothetical protein